MDQPRRNFFKAFVAVVPAASIAETPLPAPAVPPGSKPYANDLLEIDEPLSMTISAIPYVSEPIFEAPFEVKPVSTVELRVEIEKAPLHNPFPNPDKSPKRWKWGPAYVRLTKFELSWDGIVVPIADRYWRDVGGITLQRMKAMCPTAPSNLALDSPAYKAIEDQMRQWVARDEVLQRPRVWLCADDPDCVLIEWHRSGE
jgi:hypothetical protein